MTAATPVDYFEADFGVEKLAGLVSHKQKTTDPKYRMHLTCLKCSSLTSKCHIRKTKILVFIRNTIVLYNANQRLKTTALLWIATEIPKQCRSEMNEFLVGVKSIGTATDRSYWFVNVPICLHLHLLACICCMFAAAQELFSKFKTINKIASLAASSTLPT